MASAALIDAMASGPQNGSGAVRQQRRRTIDVTTGAASFDELLLPRWLLQGLAAAGFLRPSPVQTAAIPIGRMGADLVVQVSVSKFEHDMQQVLPTRRGTHRICVRAPRDAG